MKVSFITLGCRVNHYESEALRDQLGEIGIECASKGEKSDICVINTCAVTDESVRKSRQAVRRAVSGSPGAMVCVIGCASQLDPATFSGIDGVSFVCGTRNRGEAFDAIKSFSETGTFEKKVSVRRPDGELPPASLKRFDRARAYVKIEDGCNGHCTYCVIKDVRGPAVVRQEAEILKEVADLAISGCREVVFTGIETAAYGRDLPTLVEKAGKIDGIDRIRLGSLDPAFLTRDAVDRLSSCEKFCPHFHVSVQSASDRILSLMKRKYNSGILEKNLRYAKETIPGLSLTADLIVGFPTETEEDFLMTSRFVEEFDLLHCHIFRFSRRPGTEAASMDGQISAEVSGNRAERLSGVAWESKLRALEKIRSAGRAEVLCERCAGGMITGHTANFAECAFKPAGRFTKGKTACIRLTGVDREKGILIGAEETV